MERPTPEHLPARFPFRFLRLTAELFPIMLILAAVAGTLTLLIAAHRRPVAVKKSSPTPFVPVVMAEPVPESAPTPAPPLPPPPRPEDRTPRELARLDALAAVEVAAAERAERGAEALERARKRSLASIETHDRRERAIRSRAEQLEDRVLTIEANVENLAIDRDILTQKRDAARLALAKDRVRARAGYSIQPYRGANGTWRRPIPVECTDGLVKIQPAGPAFSLFELSPMGGLRSNPFLEAMARETVRSQGGPSPDGAPVVPYVLFVVRPDGIRPYYEALARLEPLGLAFGYELVAQDLEINFPDPNDLADWDRSAPPPERWPTTRPLAGGPSGPNGEAFPTFADYERGGRTGGYATDSDGKPVIFSGQGQGSPDDATAPPTGGGVRRGNGPGNSPRGRPSGGASGGDRFKPPVMADLAARGFARPGSSGMPKLPARGYPRPEQGGSLGLGSGRYPSSGPPGLADTPSTGDSQSSQRALTELVSEGAIQSGRVAPGTGGSEAGKPGGSQGHSPKPTQPSSSEMGEPGSPSAPARNIGLKPNLPSGGVGSGWGGRPDDHTATSDAESLRRLGALAAGGVAGSPGGSASSPGNTAKRPGGGDPLPVPQVRRGLELVVVCESKGVILEPGAYRLSSATLKAKDANLVKALRTIVAARGLADPKTAWEPRVRFLIEPGGHRTYWTARGQVLVEGLNWPTSVQIAPGGPLTAFRQELR